MKGFFVRLLGVLLVAALILAGFVSGPWWVAEARADITASSSGFNIPAVGEGEDSDFVWIQGKAEHSCIIYGTFGGVSIDLETLVEGTPDSPTKLKDVSVAALVSVTSESAFVAINLYTGHYRLEATGGDGTTAVKMHCRK